MKKILIIGAIAATGGLIIYSSRKGKKAESNYTEANYQPQPSSGGKRQPINFTEAKKQAGNAFKKLAERLKAKRILNRQQSLPAAQAAAEAKARNTAANALKNAQPTPPDDTDAPGSGLGTF